MNIIIVGDGKVGATLVEHLSKEGHDVVVIDRDPKVIEQMVNSYDVMGICGNGAYIVGTQKAVEKVCAHITSPALLNEVGSFERGYREFYQGLFLAPHIVANALKGMMLVGEVMKSKNYEILPESNQMPNDIIKSIKFDTADELIKFVQMVQYYSPIDSEFTPMPWDMPGYSDQIIMAAGTFVGGASIELSCDAPINLNVKDLAILHMLDLIPSTMLLF